MTEQTPIPLPPAARVPAGPIPPGSEAHKALFCTELLRTHDPSRPALIDWPALAKEMRAKIVSLPIRDMAVQIDGREEGRRIGFIMWVAWWRSPWPRFEAKVVAGWAFLIGELVGMAKGMGRTSKVGEEDFTLKGLKEPGIEIGFAEPGAIRLALNVTGRCSATT